ncbi:hypothetical protein PIB30_032639 [Stylosanthes scabra]|uniref:NAD(P)H-quinone oxidoreductase subunit L, chloroplastic n=2 Tax=Stylosanthes scabra TaxID=79078 RepID=A0ABU6WCF2_9FABA|nr:hypothetical protein [Stylosanthes scabra]
MSSSLSFHLHLHLPRALPPLPTQPRGISSLFIASKHEQPSHKTTSSQSLHITCSSKRESNDSIKKQGVALHIGAALLALAEQPALAVTGENNHPVELTWILTQAAVVFFLYFLVAPPVIMNWLRIRWYRRKLGEMYLQFMFVFIFFPAIIVWAPFLNFRKFPRDPSLKFPWSVPEDPSKIRNSYSKYPFAEPEDYDYP